MRASSTRIDELLLHMACSLGRWLRQAERPSSAKNILLRQRAARQVGSESVDSKPGNRQASASQFSIAIHTTTCSPHLVLYKWLTGPRLYQSACARERLARTWSSRQVPRFRAQSPGDGTTGVVEDHGRQAAQCAAGYPPPKHITRAGRLAQVLGSR